MCNLASMTKGQQAIGDLARAMQDTTGNLPSLPGIFPDYPAPIVRNAPDGVRELAMVRWEMPSSRKAIFEKAKVRAGKLEARVRPSISTSCCAWSPTAERPMSATRRALTGSHGWGCRRCVVPLTSFSEFDPGAKQDVWFALSHDRPLAFFAGIWTPQWTGVRKIKNGVETTDLFAFLTTEPNREVGAIHQRQCR